METETVKLSKTERLLITNLELLVKRVREAHVDADGLVNDCPVCVSLVLSEEAIKSAKKNSSHYEYLKCLAMIDECLSDGIPIEKDDPIHKVVKHLLTK